MIDRELNTYKKTNQIFFEKFFLPGQMLLTIIFFLFKSNDLPYVLL